MHNRKRKKNKSLEIAKKMCLGKIKHGSILAAEYVKDKMRGRETHLLKIYKCKFCNGFHIGHDR